MKRRLNFTEELLQTPSVPLATFGTGEVAQILGAEIWRVQKYIDCPKYGINPTGKQLGGSGKGSRRVFTVTDVYRLGIADHLVRNGFSYKFVSNALEQICEEDLLGPFNQEGEELDLVYLLLGSEENVQVRGIGREKTIREAMKFAKDAGIYLLDINKIILGIQKRMRGK